MKTLIPFLLFVSLTTSVISRTVRQSNEDLKVVTCYEPPLSILSISKADNFYLNISSARPFIIEQPGLKNVTLDFYSEGNERKPIGFMDLIFEHLSSLKILTIRNGVFLLSPNPFKNLHELTALTIVNSESPSLPQEFLSDFPELVVLSLEGHNLATITSQMFSTVNENIREIELSFGPIATIEPRSFTRLRHLKFLSFALNQLTDIQKDMFEGLGELEILNLELNQLTVLRRDALKNLPKLRGFKARYNEIRTVEVGVFEGLPLRTIHLAFNHLTTLEPGVFDGLNQLKDLNLFGNKLITLSNNVFNGLVHLNKLNLCMNSIENIEANAFSGVSVEELCLRGNVLHTIEEGMFAGLNVTGLDLSDCGIMKIQPGAFRDTRIQMLWIAKNGVPEVDKAAWGEYPAADVITTE